MHNTNIRSLKDEIIYYIRLALPMIISLWTEPIMHFFDRLFLSHYRVGEGEVYLNAGLVGGLATFTFFVFFTSITGYTNTIVAQYFGAKKQTEAGKIVLQSIIIGVCVLPLFILISLVIDDVFTLFNHDALQTKLEIQYSRILLYGGTIVLIRSGISGFFSAIGKSNVIMLSSLFAMCLNILLNYIFIFGKFGIPEMGIQGAALATNISSLVALCILCIVYLSKKYDTLFQTRIPIRINWNYIKKFFKFALPSGVEKTISVMVFSIFIFAMSSYGTTVGAAVTIAINWDSFFFIPMVGASIATTAIIGQYIGSRQISQVYRVIFIAIGLQTIFMLFLIYMFIFQYEMLISMFTAEMNDGDKVFALAKTMLPLVCIYLGFDAVSLTISSVLNGSGDTKALMYVMIIVDVLFFIAIILFIIPQKANPIQAWWIFIGFPISIAVGVLIRFFQGKWQHIVMVDNNELSEIEV